MIDPVAHVPGQLRDVPRDLHVEHAVAEIPRDSLVHVPRAFDIVVVRFAERRDDVSSPEIDGHHSPGRSATGQQAVDGVERGGRKIAAVIPAAIGELDHWRDGEAAGGRSLIGCPHVAGTSRGEKSQQAKDDESDARRCHENLPPDLHGAPCADTTDCHR